MNHWAEDGRLRRLGQALVAVCVAIGMVLVAAMVGALVDVAGVHLCGWPATISCDHGLPFAWSALRWGMWACAAVAGLDVLLWLRSPSDRAWRRIQSWLCWGPVVVAAAFLTVTDRTLGPGDVAVGALLVLAALELIRRTLADRIGISERAAFAVVLPLVLVVLPAPLWAPRAFAAVEGAEPLHDERRRREESAECLREQQSERLRPDEIGRACEIYPSVDDGRTPPG